MTEFARIVCGAPPVHTAFDGVGGWAGWWRLMLRLHGKPTTPALTEAERCAVLVRGFRFYGRLYLGLGLLLLAVPGLAGLDLLPAYALGLSGLGGAYLLAVSRLAFRGAELYGRGRAQGSLLLALFFVGVLVFLGAFAAVASVIVHQQQALGDLPNLALFTLFGLFGAGSYVVELVYLLTTATVPSAASSTRCSPRPAR